MINSMRKTQSKQTEQLERDFHSVINIILRISEDIIIIEYQRYL